MKVHGAFGKGYRMKEKLKGSGISPEDFDSMAEGAKRAWSGLPLHS